MKRQHIVVFLLLVSTLLGVSASKRVEDRLLTGKCAVTTLLYDGDAGFVLGAATLGHSLRESKTRMEMVALVTENVDAEARKLLVDAGWMIHDAKAVSNPNPEYFPRLEYVFTKLQIYTLTNYERVVYLDADTLVNENVDELCGCNAYHCSVVRNTFFNSGVIVAIPSLQIYNDMMSKYTSMHSYTGGDQGFLNNYFWNSEECPFFNPQQKLTQDVSHLRCYRLPGYYNGDVGVYVSRGDKWQFDPDEERQQPKITHYTLSIFKPWAWPTYIVVKDSWKWFRVYSDYVNPSAVPYLFQLALLCIVAIVSVLLFGRVKLTYFRTPLGLLMFNRIGRAFLGHIQHLIVFLFSFYYSQLTLYNPTFSLTLFFTTYCVLFEICCVALWERYWETAAGTRLTFDQTSALVYKTTTCVSLGLLLILLWSDLLTVYGRAASMIVWLFCVPGVIHTIFYQIIPLTATNK